jgi:hypothetical protein
LAVATGHRVGPDQEVRVLGHEPPANHQEARLLPKWGQGFHRATMSEAVRKKNHRAPISARGDELRVGGCATPVIEGHSQEEVPQGRAQCRDARRKPYRLPGPADLRSGACASLRIRK